MSLMVALQSKFIIPSIECEKAQNFAKNACLLWVWHADKIPPHIGFSIRNSYYSLKANGKDENVALDKILLIIERKKIKTLCFALDFKLEVADLATIYSLFKTTIPGEITCLAPIKKIVGNVLATKLTELLEDLYSKGKVRQVYGHNIDDSFEGLYDYSLLDVHSRLQKLAND